MVMSRRRATGSVALLLALALAGCSSSGSGGGGSSAPPGSTAASTDAAVGTAPDPATKAAITTAYKSFFNSNTSQAESEAALQHGATFHETLAKEAAGSNAQNSSVTVGKITVSGDVGTVTFSILQSGASLLSNAEGFAVRENGTWKVAAQTFCSLLNLEQTAPPACKDPAITALPH